MLKLFKGKRLASQIVLFFSAAGYWSSPQWALVTDYSDEPLNLNCCWCLRR